MTPDRLAPFQLAGLSTGLPAPAGTHCVLALTVSQSPFSAFSGLFQRGSPPPSCGPGCAWPQSATSNPGLLASRRPRRAFKSVPGPLRGTERVTCWTAIGSESMQSVRAGRPSTALRDGRHTRSSGAPTGDLTNARCLPKTSLQHHPRNLETQRPEDLACPRPFQTLDPDPFVSARALGPLSPVVFWSLVLLVSLLLLSLVVFEACGCPFAVVLCVPSHAWLMARSEQLRQLAVQLASLASASLEDVVTHGLQSLLETLSGLIAHVSFFVSLLFVDSCLFNHLVQFRFSLGALFAALIPCVRFFFQG